MVYVAGGTQKEKYLEEEYHEQEPIVSRHMSKEETLGMRPAARAAPADSMLIRYEQTHHILPTFIKL